MSRTKHTVTDSRGKTYTRTSNTRIYTHAVVILFNADATRHWVSRTKAEWASSLQNAQNNAARWERVRERDCSYVEDVEIIEVVR